MKIEDIYYNEVFDVTDHGNIMHHVSKLFKQMANRPVGLYYIKEWPTFKASFDAANDQTLGRLSARMTFINIEAMADPKSPYNISLTMEDIVHALRAKNTISSPIPRSKHHRATHGAGRLMRSGWDRITRVLHRCRGWTSRGRAACGRAVKSRIEAWRQMK